MQSPIFTNSSKFDIICNQWVVKYMNKKVNLYLNITGFASFLLSFLLIFISLKLEASTGILIYLARMILFILGMASGLLFIGIKEGNFLFLINLVIVSILCAVGSL